MWIVMIMQTIIACYTKAVIIGTEGFIFNWRIVRE